MYTCFTRLGNERKFYPAIKIKKAFLYNYATYRRTNFTDYHPILSITDHLLIFIRGRGLKLFKTCILMCLRLHRYSWMVSLLIKSLSCMQIHDIIHTTTEYHDWPRAMITTPDGTYRDYQATRCETKMFGTVTGWHWRQRGCWVGASDCQTPPQVMQLPHQHYHPYIQHNPEQRE